MIKKEIVAVAGEYTTASGETKKKWLTIGHIHTTKDGTREYITLDPCVNLAGLPRKDGDDRVYANLFDPKPRGQAAPQQQAPVPQGSDPFDDDIPY